MRPPVLQRRQMYVVLTGLLLAWQSSNVSAAAPCRVRKPKRVTARVHFFSSSTGAPSDVKWKQEPIKGDLSRWRCGREAQMIHCYRCEVCCWIKELGPAFSFNHFLDPCQWVTYVYFIYPEKRIKVNHFDEGILAFFNWFGFDVFKSTSLTCPRQCSALKNLTTLAVVSTDDIKKRRIICLPAAWTRGLCRKMEIRTTKESVLPVIHFLLG